MFASSRVKPLRAALKNEHVVRARAGTSANLRDITKSPPIARKLRQEAPGSGRPKVPGRRLKRLSRDTAQWRKSAGSEFSRRGLDDSDLVWPRFTEKEETCVGRCGSEDLFVLEINHAIKRLLAPQEGPE